MARNLSNLFVDTTLVAGIGAGAVSMTMADPVVASLAPPFALTIFPAGNEPAQEIVYVTALDVTRTIATITRGEGGTTDAPHGAGETVRHSAIAGDFTDLQAAIGSAVTLSTYATATMTLDTQPSDGKTFIIGAQAYTFVAGAQTNPGDIPIGGALADTQTSVVAGVNGADFFNTANPDAALTPFSSDQAAVVAAVAGAAGNSIALGGDFAGEGGNGFSGAALAGGSDGTTTGHVVLESASLLGPSPATFVLRLQPAPGVSNLAEVYYILEIKDEFGNRGAGFDAFGTLDLFAGLNVNNGALQIGSSGQFLVQPTGAGIIASFRNSSGNPELNIWGQNFSPVLEITPRYSNQIGLIIYSFGGDVDQIQATGLPDFNNVFRVLQRGAVVTAQHTAPDDTDLAIGELSWWFDQTNGAAKAMFKGKSADGTVVTGEVALV